MAPGTKRQASQAPRAASKKTKTSKSKSVKAEDAVAEAEPSSDREATRTQDDDEEAVAGDDDLPISLEIKMEAWVPKFRGIIAAKEAKILKHLETRKAAINDRAETLRSQLLPIFAHALLPIDVNENPKEPMDIDEDDDSTIYVPFPSMGQQALGDKLKVLYEKSKNLVRIYDDLAKEDESTPKVSRLENLKADFEKNQNAALEQLAAGKSMALLDVQGMLADRYHEVRGRSGLSRDVEVKGRCMLAKGVGADRDGEEGNGKQNGRVDNDDGGENVLMGWGNVAVDMQKAVKKLDDVVANE